MEKLSDGKVDVPGHPAPVREGLVWFKEGAALVRAYPLTWVLMLLLYGLLFLGLFFVPLLGMELSALLAPVLSGGVLLAARNQEAGQAPVVRQLFAAFEDRALASRLVTVGGIFLVANIVVSYFLVPLIVGFDTYYAVLEGSGTPDPRQLAWVKLWQLVFLIPLTMANCYAPALVTFHKTAPLAAFRLSFLTCLYNAGPLLLLGLLILLAALVGLIPLGLGLVFIPPLIATTTYVSYRHLLGATQGA